MSSRDVPSAASERLAAAAAAAHGDGHGPEGGAIRVRGPAPVHLWNPPDCGEIAIRIGADGAWHHEGAPIRREALVRLFASILRRDGERYVLVTPGEKLGIVVDDLPFLAVEMRVDEAGREAPGLSFRTSLDDWVTAGAEHPLRFERAADGGLKPAVRLRGDLWARLGRPLVEPLLERGEARGEGTSAVFGVASGDAFFAVAPLSEVEDLDAAGAAGVTDGAA